MNRDFKGIWIPREIWLNKNLSTFAKNLWGEIHSLHDREIGGCYASDAYLTEFMDTSDRNLRRYLKELKDAGLLENISFNGRERVMKAIMPSFIDFSSLNEEVK